MGGAGPSPEKRAGLSWLLSTEHGQAIKLNKALFFPGLQILLFPPVLDSVTASPAASSPSC